MEIEETVGRRTYRDFDLVQLRQGNAQETRWYISNREFGMKQNYGFAISESDALRQIDILLKRQSEGRDI